ncbi:MAG: NAD(P)H-hydrate dehydratase [Kiritimatiellae bacterium]|nr:NAD(P)H-hydrate dehydratase [Kiritimatiellia bacterium]
MNRIWLIRRAPLQGKVRRQNVNSSSYIKAVPSELIAGFKARPIDADKRSVGTVAVVGGSRHFIHAPVMAALGARAAGAGLVQLVVPDASRIAAGALVPEATFSKLIPTCAPPHADVTIIGTGLGISVTSEVIVSRFLSGSNGRFVLDADALATLASWYGRTDGYDPAIGQELILTPHEGEAANLLGWKREQVIADRLAAAKEISERYGATTILKGPHTLVVSADGKRVYKNEAGNPFMALGGMGDLLAGVVAARWAYLKQDPFLAAASATWLHSHASDLIVAEGIDPSIVNTASRIGSLRVRLDSASSNS